MKNVYNIYNKSLRLSHFKLLLLIAGDKQFMTFCVI